MNSPSSQEKAFRLFRSALNRDASMAELVETTGKLENGSSWPTVLDHILESSEFANRVPTYCGSSSVGWQSVPPANIVVTNAGGSTNERQLRNALAKARVGSFVYLEQGATILLSDTLTIPVGVTLATIGLPGKVHAPLLGRLARNGVFKGPLVELLDDSRLLSVWIDDQRNRFGFPKDTQGRALNGPPVYVHGSNAVVANDIISDSTTWTHLQFLHSGTACNGGHIASNLITAFGSSHWDATWSDGIPSQLRPRPAWRS